MSSRIFQNVIIQMKDSVEKALGVVDDQGFVIASSELAMIGSRLDDFRAAALEGAEHPVASADRTYCPLSSSRFSKKPLACVRWQPAVSVLH